MFKYKSLLKALQDDLSKQTLFKKVFVRIFFRLRFDKIIKSHKDNNIILIYTAGKDGSSTLFYTLMKEMPYKKIFHLHALVDKRIGHMRVEAIREKNRIKANNYKEYVNNQENKKISVISMVRDPVEKMISGFFQNYNFRYSDKLSEMSTEDIGKEVCKWGGGVINGRDWFEDELIIYLNYNIYNEPFNKKLGYKIYNVSEKINLLIIRTDKLNQVFGRALKEFLGGDVKKLYTFNETKNKQEGDIYKKIKNGFYLNEHDGKYIYGLKYMKYFYTDEEREKMKNKWVKK